MCPSEVLKCLRIILMIITLNLLLSQKENATCCLFIEFSGKTENISNLLLWGYLNRWDRWHSRTHEPNCSSVKELNTRSNLQQHEHVLLISVWMEGYLSSVRFMHRDSLGLRDGCVFSNTPVIPLLKVIPLNHHLKACLSVLWCVRLQRLCLLSLLILISLLFLFVSGPQHPEERCFWADETQLSAVVLQNCLQKHVKV